MLTLYTTTCFSLNHLFDLASSLSKEEGTIFLFSGVARAELSYLLFFPYEEIAIKQTPFAWEQLKDAFSFIKNGCSIPEWAGFLSYELGISDASSTNALLAKFYKASCVLVYDHKEEKVCIYHSEEGKKRLPHEKRAFIEKIHEEILWEKNHAIFAKPKLISASDTLFSYSEKIETIKEWILEGKVYQVNLSQRFLFEKKGNVFSLFENLCKLNPAPFSAFLQCKDFAIVSSSPERFLKKRGTFLETRPIKGTAPRGKTEAEDKEIQKQLLMSEKERSELLMIIDLSRNDLSKVSIPGSCQVRELYRCEAYTNVYHLVGIIESQHLQEIDPIGILKSCFPGGSITGCPKLAAIEAIAKLENRARGIYTGSIGYFCENGDFDFNIAIRTLLVENDLIEIQLGGAITIDSDPVAEFEETLHKGASIFKILNL